MKLDRVAAALVEAARVINGNGLAAVDAASSVITELRIGRGTGVAGQASDGEELELHPALSQITVWRQLVETYLKVMWLS